MNPSSEWAESLVGCFTLTKEGWILSANATVRRWLGYAPEEMVGRPVHTFLGSGGQFFLQSQILPMLTLKGSLEEIYLRMTLKAGGTVTVLANFAYFSAANPASIALSFLRIPQRGRLEDELLQARKLAEQASDAKTKFLGMMSHELRTPLGAISLNLQMLLDGMCGKLTFEQHEVITASEREVGAVASLIDDILAFAQMRGGTVSVALVDLPVRSAVERAAVSLRHRFQQAGLTFVECSADPPLLGRYDANRLQQIVLNLLNNALKFTPRGGTISLGDRRDGDAFVIDVSDTGCGIPAEQLQRVFEPFVQLHTVVESGEKPGVGLGLAICRDLAFAMGGTIRVQSTVGVGSTFSVALPLASVPQG